MNRGGREWRLLRSAALVVGALVALLFCFSRAAFAGATVSQGKVFLTWAAEADPNSGNDGDYQIYRGLNGGTPTFLNSTAKTVTAYTDSTAANGNSYTYRVYFLRNGAPVDVLNESVAVQLAAPTLTATLNGGRVDLAWSTPAEATNHYYLYRSVNGAPASQYALLAFGTNAYTDSSVTNGNTYAYHVKASNFAGLGLASATQSVEVQIAAPR